MKPDASGFLIDGKVDDMPAMVQLGHAIGLCLMTTYVDIVEGGKNESLQRAGMQPAMVRLRQSGPGKKVVWQVGWRSTTPRFDECLHSVNIDDEVSAQINKLISNIC